MSKKPDKKATRAPGKQPSLPIPGTSKQPASIKTNTNDAEDETKDSWRKRCCNYMYDRENKLFCGRSCTNWFSIIIYSIMYLIFLSTYTLIFLFGSLSVIKYMDDYQNIDKIDLLTYSSKGIGLSATPTGLNSTPIIWYRNDVKDYQKYVNAISDFLKKRRKRGATNATDLGPCGTSPFGYGREPCIIIRINKQYNWSGKPLFLNISEKMNLPLKVKNYLKLEKQKLWLNCEGYRSKDKEHIGNINYYPDPPGFDPELFPLNENAQSPLIAVQISNFTLGKSLVIECKLWYNEGVSTIQFTLYVCKD